LLYCGVMFWYALVMSEGLYRAVAILSTQDMSE
jgi:hypothetical protein